MKALVLFCVLCFDVILPEAFQHTHTIDAGKQPYHRNASQGFVSVNFLFHPNSTLEVAEEKKLQLAAQNYKQCLVACASNLTCFSINFGKQPINFDRGEAQYLCELLPTDKYSSSIAYQNSTTFNHYSIKLYCEIDCKYRQKCLVLRDNELKGAHFNCNGCDELIRFGISFLKSECNKSPCLHNFPCIAHYHNDTYECLCQRPQFEGKHCQDVDECARGQHNCRVGSNCTNTIGSFNCLQMVQDSGILKDYGNASYLAALKTFMDDGGEDIISTPWIRCWSGKTDGFDVTKTFHPQCDGKGPTIFIIRDGQYIWGGYANIPWQSGRNGYKSSTNSFIFSLYNIHGFSPLKFPVLKSSYAIYHNGNWAPTFSTDLRMTNFASTSGLCYMRPSSYAVPPGCTSGTACDFFNGIAGSYHAGFSIDDIEVYYKTAG